MVFICQVYFEGGPGEATPEVIIHGAEPAGRGCVFNFFSAMFICRWMLIAGLCGIPFTAYAQWTLQQDMRSHAGCVLVSGVASVFDGYNDTSLKLAVHDRKLLVMTDANIDLGASDVGLSVDKNKFIEADGVTNETNVLFETNIESIIEQFIRGRSVKLYLRFWPSYPSKGRHETSFSLIGFTKAYKSLTDCLNN
jgi:hypothetical protein